MISIIIPAYNEEESLPAVINKCKETAASYGNGSEIIVVDDGSSDSTFGIASSAGVKLLRHPLNTGYGRALKDGISSAKNDLVVIADADGTYPIQDIPELVDIYRKGFDMVVGSRQGKYYNESFNKKALRRILKFIVEFTTGRKIDDINSGLRVFSKKTIIGYFDRLCDTFSFTTSLTLAYMMTGRYVAYFPVRYERRAGKTKVRILRDSLRTLQFIFEAVMYYNPIKIYLLFSSFLAGASLISLTAAFFLKLPLAYILAGGLILSAILNLSIGFISIQLKGILNSAKKGLSS